MIQHTLTIIYTNYYFYWTKYVGVISKHNRGPVFLRHSVDVHVYVIASFYRAMICRARQISVSYDL